MLQASVPRRDPACRVRWDLVAGIAALALGAAFSGASAAGKARAETGEGAAGVTLTQNLDRERLRPGRKTRWEIRVEGSRKPVEIRLHNFSPGIVRVHGGSDQIVRTSGGRNNRLRRRVTGLAPGAARLDAWLYRQDPGQRASVLAARIAPLLAEIEAAVTERSRDLREAAPESSPGEQLAGLLAGTERRLLSVLDFPELTALGDYVHQAFSILRTEMAEQAHRPVGTIRTAAFRGLDAAPPAGTSVSRILDALAELLRGLVRRAENRDLLLDLCVVSEPAGATLLLHPLSAPKRSRTLATSAALPNVWRGLYAYRLKSPGLRGIDCARGQEPVPAPCPLDLMGDSRAVLRCTLAPAGNRPQEPASSCYRLEGWSEECGDRDR